MTFFPYSRSDEREKPNPKSKTPKSKKVKKQKLKGPHEAKAHAVVPVGGRVVGTVQNRVTLTQGNFL